MSETIQIYDFYFTIDGNLVEQYFDFKDAEAAAAEYIAKHMEYHDKIENTKYVPAGSILGCTYGSLLARLDAQSAAEVYTGNGAPVLTCNDCAVGVNIPTFGTCTNSESAGMGMPARTYGTYGNAKASFGKTYEPTGYKCIPIVDGSWQQPGKDTVLIWNPSLNNYSRGLKSNAILICKYGGIIGVMEVEDATQKGTGGFITVAQLTSIFQATGFFQKDSVTQAMVDDLNRVLEENDISSKQETQMFLAACVHESRLSLTEAGYLSVAKAQAYCAKYDNNSNLGNKGAGEGYLFRGAGYIQLTGRYNYQKFSDFITANYRADPNIMAMGADWVASNYPWEAAAYFWNRDNLNNVIAEGNKNNMTEMDIFFRVSNGINRGAPKSSSPPSEWSDRQLRYIELKTSYN